MIDTTNQTMDAYWRWWGVHLWVEGVWELILGGLLSYLLIKLTGVDREVVEKWLYVIVGLTFLPGILGTGHHYYFIGTPRYWLWIDGIFSALEPLAFLGMAMYAIAMVKRGGRQHPNTIALNWTVGCAIMSAVRAGFLGFAHTLPQVNLYTHGTLVTAMHGHLAFWGAYAMIVLAMISYCLPLLTGRKPYETGAAAFAFWTSNVGMVSMTGAFVPWPTLFIAHGPLMVCGFLGTLIGVERAVALGVFWPYAAPLLTAVGTLALLTGLPAPPLMTLGSLGLVAIFVVIMHRQWALATVTMALGALLWLVGNAFWLVGWPVAQVVPWWSGFLVLTIAGERLELSRLLRLSLLHHVMFLLAVSIFLVGLMLLATASVYGGRVTGVGMVALAWWLLRYDIARRTVRQTGLTRFIAVCLLSGYVWLVQRHVHFVLLL
jgi:hypothetical protein